MAATRSTPAWRSNSLKEWKWLSAQAGLPVFHACGVLFFFRRDEPYFTATAETHRRMKLPTEFLRGPQLRKKFPQADWSGIDYGVWEPEFGVLMARRGVQTLKDLFVRAGGAYLQAHVRPPNLGKDRDRLQLHIGDGQTVRADQYVFACGPWLGKLFPELLGERIFVTRQEVYFFAPKGGDESFGPGRWPAWADFNEGDLWYGVPDLEARGFKIAHDKHGPVTDPDRGDRTPTAAGIEDARAYLGRRFPGLAGRPLNEARVCQYENSSSGDYLIDRHPRAFQRAVRRRGLGPRLQERPGRGPRGGCDGPRPGAPAGTALHPGVQGERPESRRPLGAAGAPLHALPPRLLGHLRDFDRGKTAWRANIVEGRRRRRAKAPPKIPPKLAGGPKGILFVHSNFPGQFRDLAKAMKERGERIAAIGAHTAPGMDGVPMSALEERAGQRPRTSSARPPAPRPT